MLSKHSPITLLTNAQMQGAWCSNAINQGKLVKDPEYKNSIASLARVKPRYYLGFVHHRVKTNSTLFNYSKVKTTIQILVQQINYKVWEIWWVYACADLMFKFNSLFY